MTQTRTAGPFAGFLVASLLAACTQPRVDVEPPLEILDPTTLTMQGSGPQMRAEPPPPLFPPEPPAPSTLGVGVSPLPADAVRDAILGAAWKRVGEEISLRHESDGRLLLRTPQGDVEGAWSVQPSGELCWDVPAELEVAGCQPLFRDGDFLRRADQRYATVADMPDF